jgi:hypothetical protein
VNTGSRVLLGVVTARKPPKPGQSGDTLTYTMSRAFPLLLTALVSASSCSDSAGAGDPDAADVVAIDANPAKCEGEQMFYADSDRDLFGDPDVAVCAARPGYVTDNTDCDDSSAVSFPGNDEICDGLDNDCDDAIDEGACTEGCADGEREGFVVIEVHPDIAGCSGAWSVPGLAVIAAPACGRQAGDDGANAGGTGCNVEDLCQPGWHVCRTSAEVAASASGGGCAGATSAGAPILFFASRQSGPGDGNCGIGDNDLFGCGNLGAGAKATCAPLDRFSDDLCKALGAPWACGADGLGELGNVVKTGPDRGGVLCCRNQ